MRSPLNYIVATDYLRRIVNKKFIKEVKVVDSGPRSGDIHYTVGEDQYKIKAVHNIEEHLQTNVAAHMLIEGYIVINTLDNTYVVISPNNSEPYFVSNNTCTCADRYPPCKHQLFVDWYIRFRKEQVRALQKIMV